MFRVGLYIIIRNKNHESDSDVIFTEYKFKIDNILF